MKCHIAVDIPRIHCLGFFQKIVSTNDIVISIERQSAVVPPTCRNNVFNITKIITAKDADFFLKSILLSGLHMPKN